MRSWLRPCLCQTLSLPGSHGTGAGGCGTQGVRAVCACATRLPLLPCCCRHKHTWQQTLLDPQKRSCHAKDGWAANPQASQMGGNGWLLRSPCQTLIPARAVLRGAVLYQCVSADRPWRSAPSWLAPFMRGGSLLQQM